MDADAITVIFDDRELFPVPGGPWSTTKGSYPSRYNDTSSVLELTSGDIPVWFSPPLDDVQCPVLAGASVQLYGIAPPVPFNQTFVVSVAGPPREYSYHTPGYGGLQYTSLNISTEGLAQAAGFALDYLVVTVYPTTDLLGKTILVDDSSLSLIWRGAWTEDNNFTLAVYCIMPFNTTSFSPAEFGFVAHMAPHANTTHASQTVGDEFEFWFTGTSISVYGVTPAEPESDPFATSWLLRMSFTLDAAQPIVVNFTSQDFTYEQPHVVYFNASSIPAGNHSLVGRVVDVVGTTLPRARIDYITYKPSFVSQAEMPVLPPFAPTTTNSSTSPTTSSDAGSGGSAKAKINKAPVAGGAVGAVVFCGLAIVLVVYMLRRPKRNRFLFDRTLHHDQADDLEPFRGSSASTSDIMQVRQKRGPSMQLRNDTVTQEPRTVVQEPAHAGPPAVGTPSEPLVDTPAVHGDDIDGSPQPAPRPNTAMLDSRVRELQTLVEQLTQEVREQVLPPPYEGDSDAA
ncbi:hypothetical protein C8F01DRAFT_1086608 [Mycena amicta]|nr:hypothetical protein C8F01DRAFT_1086608 [Mycena amicta]